MDAMAEVRLSPEKSRALQRAYRTQWAPYRWWDFDHPLTWEYEAEAGGSLED